MVFLLFACHQKVADSFLTHVEHFLRMDSCCLGMSGEASKIGQVIQRVKICSSMSHAAVCIVCITIIIMVAKVVTWYF